MREYTDAQIMEMINKGILDYDELSKEQRRNKQIIIAALEAKCIYYDDLLVAMRKDDDILHVALKQKQIDDIEILPKSLLKNEEFTFELMSNFPDAYHLIPDKLKTNYDFVKAALENGGSILSEIPEGFTINKELALLAVDGRVLKHASNRLKNDQDICLEAVKQTEKAIRHFGDNIKTDSGFMKQCMPHNKDTTPKSKCEKRKMFSFFKK